MTRPLINDPRTTHFMLDIETLSTSPRAYIASIACSVFEPWSDVVPEVGKAFNARIGLNDKTQCDRHIDMKPDGTVWWWLNQNSIAIERALHGANEDSLEDALGSLRDYLMNHEFDTEDAVFWFRGLSFDPAILRDAFTHTVTGNPRMPWKFWNEMDVRVVENIALARGIPKWKAPAISGDYDPIKHDPVYDVLDQIRQVQHYLGDNWDMQYSISPQVRNLVESGKVESNRKTLLNISTRPEAESSIPDLAGQSTIDILTSQMADKTKDE